jgi:alpha-1,6-mannosyltransferase
MKIQSLQRASFSQYWILTGLTATSLLAYGGIVAVHLQYGTLRDGYTPNTLTWYALAFVAYLGTLLWAELHQGLSSKIIWGGAILFRVLLLFTVPTLSDDVYRYLWDGHVANNGVSPYAYPIDSPALDYLDTPQRALANNTWMASPYLPVAQYLFASLIWLFPPNPLAFQVTMLILDLLNGILLVKLLKIASLPTCRILIYLWNPLVVVEVAHSAHVDTWMTFLTLLALWFTFATDAPKIFRLLGPMALALATLTKGLPVLLLPILFWRWRWWQLILYGVVIVGLLIPPGMAAGWGLTGPLDGTGLLGALRIYGDQWNFNSGLFYWLEVTLTNQGVVEANQWAKISLGLVMGMVLLIIWGKARSTQTPRTNLRLMAVPLMAYILLTTTVHP